MSRYFNDFSDPNSLAHHGILGMKWGKRNGPPYPLAPGDHSAAEKKAGALGGSVGSRESNAKKKRAALNGGNGGIFSKKKKKAEPDVKKKTKQMSAAEDCKVTNQVKAGNNNCHVCVNAYELRRRGYDVAVYEAQENRSSMLNLCSHFTNRKGKQITGKDFDFLIDIASSKTDVHAVASFASNGRHLSFEKGKDLSDALVNKYGDNARGYISSMWSKTFQRTGLLIGHVINFEIENGNVKLLDPQAGQEVKVDDYVKATLADTTTLFRTDDKDFGDIESWMKKWGVH